MYVDVADSPAGPRLGWFLLRVAGMGRGRLIGLFVVLLAGWVGTSGALAAPPDADEAGEGLLEALDLRSVPEAPAREAQQGVAQAARRQGDALPCDRHGGAG